MSQGFPQPPSRRPVAWILGFVLMAAAFSAAGFAYYRFELTQIEASKTEDLSAVGSLKAVQIEQWRRERAADALRTSRSPFFLEALERYLARPDDPELIALWKERLRLEQSAYEYEDVLLVSTDGDVLLSAQGGAYLAGPELLEALSRALAEAKPVHSNIYEGSENHFHLDTVAPIPDSEGDVQALLVLRTHPDSYLYPLIQSWPTPSQSAETVVVDWDDTRVRFLNRLRHQPDADPLFVIPRERGEVLAVKAAGGARGIVRGRDYMGHEVVADIRAIRDSSWVMIAKVDTAELFAEARRKATQVGLLVAVSVLLAGTLTALGYRRQRARLDEIRSSILESAGEGIYGIDAYGHCTFVNRAAAELLGYTKEEMIGRHMHRLIHHRHEDGTPYPEADCPIHRASHENRGCSVDNEVFWRKDGTSLPVDYSSHPILESGSTAGAVITFRDMTERRRADAELRTSRARLAEAQRIARVGSWELDIASGRLVWSEEVYRIFGATAEGFQNSFDSFIGFVHPEDRPGLLEEQNRALSGDRALDLEHRIIRPDGEVRHVLERAELTRTPDGAAAKLSGTVQDITEHKAAQEKLKQSEALLRIAGETAQLGGWALELPERRLSWSDEVCAIHDLAPGDVPDPEAAVRYYDRPYRRGIREAFQACMTEGKPFVFESELTTAKGRRIWVRTSGAAERNDRGTIVRMQGAIQDITEQKRAQQDVDRLGLRMTTTLESITDAFVTVDRDWRFTYVNSEAERLMERTRHELIGSVLWDEFPEAVGTAFEENYRRAVRERVKVEFEEFFAPLNRHFEIRAFPSDEGIAIYFRDITERRRGEEALREASARLQGFMDHSPLHISEIDLEGRYILCNPAVTDLFGLKPAEVIGRHYSEILPPESAAHYALAIAEVVKSRKPATVEDSAVAGGRPRTFVTTIFPLFDAQRQIRSVGGIGQEVTEQRQAEETIRENETLRLIASRVARLGGWRIDLPGGVITSSDEMCAILELPAGTLRTMAEATQTYAPESREEVSRAFSEALREGTPIDVEAQLLTATGKRIWVRTLGHAIRDEGGRIIRLQGATQDITERRREEEEMEKMEAQLRQAQKMEAVGRLAGGVAHDFNNMLTVIQGHSQLVLEDLEEGHPHRMSLEEIMEAARRSEELTGQLLAFARQQAIAPRVLDLNDTIESMLKMLGRLIGEHIDLRWRPGADAGCVKMDPVQIDQILANLALNARDAIGESGTLTIATTGLDLDEEFCEGHPELSPGRYAVLSVSDTGCGMTPEVRAQVFEPFFTTKEPGKGTGLGLSTVYGILKQNSGHITVYSEPEKGTTINIYLSQVAAGSADEGEAVAAGPAPTGDETILLVEDEPALLRLTRRMVEELGYTVISAHRPQEAVELVRNNGAGIDLLLTDVVMPQMSGRELVKALHEIRPGIKCLFMSGYTADVIAHHGVLHEGLVFVQKPFSKQSLASKIREALRQA